MTPAVAVVLLVAAVSTANLPLAVACAAAGLLLTLRTCQP